MKQTSRPRRRFLLGGLGLAGALVVGWGMLPQRQRLHAARPLPLKQGAVALNGWITVEPDGRIGFVMPRTEMGQGVSTALPMLVAEELDVPLEAVVLLPLVVDKIYGNVAVLQENLPLHPDDEGSLKRGASWMMGKVARELGIMFTGGSSSVKDAWGSVRHAAAFARAALVATAAQQWQVDPASCRTEQGKVVHASGKSASYAELAKGAKYAIDDIDPNTVRLKDPAKFTLIGQPAPRRDSLDKVTGKARFAIDALPAGGLYAVLRLPPVVGATLGSLNDKAALAMPGVQAVVDVSPALHELHAVRAGVAVVAEQQWQARRAADALEIRWDEQGHGDISSDGIFKELGAKLDADRGFKYYKQGDPEGVKPARSISAEYRAPFLAHATMEPMNCTAQVKDGQVWLWTNTQVPSMAVDKAASVAGVSKDKVHIDMCYAGGGFGRRLEVDDVAIAVAVAKACKGRPVRVLWKREDDMTHDVYRPATIARFVAGLDQNGALLSWDCRAAGAAIAHQYNPRNLGLPGVGPDRAAAEGLYDMQYEVPHQHISHLAVDSVVPVGYWRGVGHSHNAFFKESFIDELAHAAKQDPVAFRRTLLARHPRHLAVLDAAVARAGTAPAGRAHGVALHQSFGSIVAEVAEVSVVQGQIRVHRVVCAVDCGIVVNPNIARQQVESAVVFGLSAALKGEITLHKGHVDQSNFHDYPVMRIDEAPEVEVVFMPSTRAPEGMGEPPLAPAAPAVANAVFALTGKRLRSLPLKL